MLRSMGSQRVRHDGVTERTDLRWGLEPVWLGTQTRPKPMVFQLRSQTLVSGRHEAQVGDVSS